MFNCLKPFCKDGMSLPCGKCGECRTRRATSWSFRLMQEEKVSSSAYFITLTYENPPMSDKGYMVLQKRDVQLWLKRVRKSVGKTSANTNIKYYVVGEYGTIGYRPHYHVIIFNLPLENLIGKKFADAVKRDELVLDGKFPFFSDSWPQGHITIGQVSGASVGYTLKYLCKPPRIPVHKNDDRIPEFSLMSKGLGAAYMTDKMVEWHKADLLHRTCAVIEDGKKIALPRYYRDRMYSSEERGLIKGYTQAYVQDLMEQNAAEMLENYGRETNKIVQERLHHRDQQIRKNSEKNRYL